MITTHVLDTSVGRPAAGVPMTLEIKEGEIWALVGEGVTDADGGLRTLMDGKPRIPGECRISFATGMYSARNGMKGFFPEVKLHFVVEDETQHFHVPLLWSPFGDSTYRGS